MTKEIAQALIVRSTDSFLQRIMSTVASIDAPTPLPVPDPVDHSQENWATLTLVQVGKTLGLTTTLADIPALAVVIMAELRTLRALSPVSLVSAPAVAPACVR